MWPSIWCKTIQHAWSISSKIMAYLVAMLNFSFTSIYLHNPNSNSSRPGGICCSSVKYKFGLPGAMVSTMLAFWIPNIGQLVYVFGGWCPETWKGFSLLAFKDLWPIIKLSLSSGAMLCLVLWYNTVIVLLAGNMKNDEVAIDALSIWLRSIKQLKFMTSRTLRRRLHPGDVDGKRHEHLESSGTDSLNEPLLGKNDYEDKHPEEARLKTLKQRLEVPFDGSCLVHQDALKQLWRLAYPDRELPALKSELWKDMGWQGPDLPLTSGVED